MNKGFTLIELLVVVLIIGILSSIALPQYNKSVAKARATEAIRAGKTWGDAQRIFYLENGYYTSDIGALAVTLPNMKYFSIGSNSYSWGSGGLSLKLTPNYSMGSHVSYIEFQMRGEGSMYGCCVGDYNTCRNIMPCNSPSCEM